MLGECKSMHLEEAKGREARVGMIKVKKGGVQEISANTHVLYYLSWNSTLYACVLSTRRF